LLKRKIDDNFDIALHVRSAGHQVQLEVRYLTI